jgi:hypothetical protein
MAQVIDNSKMSTISLPISKDKIFTIIVAQRMFFTFLTEGLKL